MAANARSQVLQIFKKLHRSKDAVFRGDAVSLTAARDKIREEFRRHKGESDGAKIQELLKVATESEEILRTKVIQAAQVQPNVYRMRGDHLQEKCVNARERCANCNCGM